MEKFRKFCIVFFACLSFFFAIVAIHNLFFLDENKLYQRHTRSWDTHIDSIAKEEDKLLFLFVNENENVSKNIKTSLEKEYVFTVLDKKNNPADYTVYNYFWQNISNSKQDLACAILTPTMKPIFLSSKIEIKKLEKILPTFAQSWKKNRDAIQKTNDIALQKQIQNIQQKQYIDNLFFNYPMPIVQASFFNEKLPIAILTENARLTFKRLKRTNSIRYLHDAQLALNALKNRLKTENNYNAKLLITRAMADIAFATNADNLKELKDIADKIVNKKPDKSPATEKSLELSILCKAYSIFGDEQYLKRAEQIVKKIENTTANEHISAIISPPFFEVQLMSELSIASALNISIMANSLCDFYDISEDKASLETALALITKLDSDYIYNNYWAINSKHSPSAKFLRIIISHDAEEPSYLGEAYQAITRIKRSLDIKEISQVERKIKSLNNLSIPAYESTHASIILAEYN